MRRHLGQSTLITHIGIRRRIIRGRQGRPLPALAILHAWIALEVLFNSATFSGDDCVNSLREVSSQRALRQLRGIPSLVLSPLPGLTRRQLRLQ